MKKVNRYYGLSILLFFITSVFFTQTVFAGQWKVKSGDNLSKIAANYPGVTAGEICRANSHMFKVKGCNHIEPGWLLVIPEVGDCFDATMTTASKQKARDEWNRSVVSNYQDGKPDCNFEELTEESDNLEIPEIVNITTVDQDLLDRIDILADTLDDHVNSKTNVFAFAVLDSSEVVGVGGLLRYPSGYSMSYQFSGNNEKYSNQLLLGKYINRDIAVMAGPKAESNSENNSDAVGIKLSALYTPKITESFFGYVEVGVSAMKVKEYQETGAPDISLNGNTLSVSSTITREESNYWTKDINFSIGIAYKF